MSFQFRDLTIPLEALCGPASCIECTFPTGALDACAWTAGQCPTTLGGFDCPTTHGGFDCPTTLGGIDVCGTPSAGQCPTASAGLDRFAACPEITRCSDVTANLELMPCTCRVSAPGPAEPFPCSCGVATANTGGGIDVRADGLAALRAQLRNM